jgi:hypothetical protein
VDKVDDVREVKPIREVPRVPQHCGKTMRKNVGTSPATGKVVTIYSCEKCGAQDRIEERTPVK